MSKRNDKNRVKVKYNLLQKYGCRCMICEDAVDLNYVQLHHIVKYEDVHITTEKDSGLVCPECHDLINYAEHCNVPLYEELNKKIRWYKKVH